jgi:protein-S-isoprenylcysteine O-methyltransferase Ste14
LNIGQLVFKLRGYVPVPFFIAVVLLANPQKDLAIFGGILVVFGEILRLAGVSYIGACTRTREIVAEEFITNGPFAYLRHPMYLGNMFIYVGASIVGGGWLPYMLYLVILLFSVLFAFQITYEESQLTKLFGEEYIMYKELVPRIFPRLTSYPEKSKKKPNVMEAIKSEKSTFLALFGYFFLILFSWYIKS